MGIICNLSCFRSFLRFYFTAERLQTVLIECDYKSELFVTTVTVSPLKSGWGFLKLEDSRLGGSSSLATVCGSNQARAWKSKHREGTHSRLALISTLHISPRWDQSSDTLKGVLLGLMLTLFRLWFHTIWSAIYCSVTKVCSLQADAAVPTPNK